ncbi:hypothetical protein D3C84_732710 [compost metagenome]
MLATGQVATPALLHLQQHREQLVDERRHFLRFAAGKARQAHQQVFFHGQAAEDFPALRHVGDPGVHTLVRLEGGDRLAFPIHCAFLGWQQAHQAFEQGGLAHAVTAEQAGDFADLHVKRQTAQDVASAVVLVQFFDLQHSQILLRSPCGSELARDGVGTLNIVGD